MDLTFWILSGLAILLFIIFILNKTKALSFAAFKNYQDGTTLAHRFLKVFSSAYTWNILLLIMMIMSMSKCSNENIGGRILCGEVISHQKNKCNCNDGEYYVDIIILLEDSSKIKKTLEQKDYEYFIKSKQTTYCVTKYLTTPYHSYTVGVVWVFILFFIASIIATIVKWKKQGVF
jgi:hypothetical protein